MTYLSLAHQVEQEPDAALAAFRRLDEAANNVLPGQDKYHSRYASIGEVGLASVVARDLGSPDSFNPFDVLTPAKLSFMADNRGLRPTAWEPAENDAAILGGPVPRWLPGRFSAFALAKLNVLGNSAEWELFSHRIDTSRLKPGEFGNAGGQRLAGSFLAKSGLWEVHDHVVGMVFADQILNADSYDAKTNTADALSGELESMFGDIQLIHDGIKAEELSRGQVSTLLVRADMLVMKRLQKNSQRDE